MRRSNVYKRKSFLFHQSTRPYGLHFMCRGRVKLVKEDPDGKTQIMRIVEGPDLLGERAFFAEQLYACSAQVMEEAHICFIEARDFWDLFGEDNRMLRQLTKRFGGKWGDSEESMHCLSAYTVKQRLAAHLLSLQEKSARSGSKEAFVLPESRTELAEIISTTPQVLSRLLGEFQAAGWMRLENRSVRDFHEKSLRAVLR